MKIRKSIITLFIITFLGAVLFSSLVGCRTPQQKHDILVNKFGDLCNVDTVVVVDTIIEIKRIPVPERKDSFIITRDTIIETELFLVEKKGDNFKVTAKKDTITFRDTIPYEIKVPTTVIKEPKTFVEKESFFIGILLILLGLVCGFKLGKIIYQD